MQFLVNSIEKVKLQYIHLYNFILNLYFMSDTVNNINDQFDEYQSLLCLKEKKLKLLVRFNDSEGQDQLLELIDDIRNTEIKL